jgi:hypothetical protein
MNIKFIINNGEANYKQDSFEKELTVIPRIGEKVYRYIEGVSSRDSRFKVIDVYHIYEEREWYKSKPEFSDAIVVELSPINKNET